MKEHLTGFTENDRNNLFESLEKLKTKSTREMIETCLGSEAFPWIIDGLTAELTFDHIAFLTLLTEGDLEKYLENKQIEVIEKKVFPSVIVQSRLRYNYRDVFYEDGSLNVKIVKYMLNLEKGMSRQIELFMPSTNIIEGVKILEREVLSGNESHYAFKTITNNPGSILRVKNLLLLACLPDGGGINKYEGTTTIYFRSVKDRQMRLEIIIPGLFPKLVS